MPDNAVTALIAFLVGIGGLILMALRRGCDDFRAFLLANIKATEMAHADLITLLKSERDDARAMIERQEARWADRVGEMASSLTEHTGASKSIYHQNEELLKKVDQLLERAR